MCQACARSPITEYLTSGLWGAAPNRRRFLAAAVSAAAAAATMAAGREARAAGDGAEIIFRNGTVYPMTPDGRPVEALAIGGGKVLLAGSASDVSSLKRSATRIVDLQGRILFPGFVDPHHHMVLSALFDDLLLNVGYPKYANRAAVLAALKAAVAHVPPGQWLRAGAYDNLLQGGDLSMADLNAISTRHPIFVLYVNGHAGAANAMAFRLAKIPPTVGELPGGGHFGRAPDGALNGLIYEQPALLRFLAVAAPPITAELISTVLASYTKAAAAAGNTTLHEPGTIKPEWVEPLAKLSNSVAVRMSASLSTDSVAQSKAFAELGPGNKARKFPNSRLSLYGMKFWADGSNQTESAAQTKPYLHTTARGNANYSASQMAALCVEAKNAGWPILVHCQGDAAIDDALDAIEHAYGAHPPTGLNRIEHATMARADQLARMKRLGAEPSFLPDLLASYGAAFRDQIFGPERTAFMEPMAACVQANIPFSLHTDSPVSPAGPLRLVQIAVTRRCFVDQSIIGADQAISIAEALKAITVHAARHIGLEDAIGTLEPGKEADLTILESDPYTAGADTIAAIKVSETWVAGEQKFG